MTNANSLKLVIGVIFLASSSALSQVTSADSLACNPKTAQMLVEQQVLESKSVVERPKRIKILLRSADFLWPLDQATARNYFIEAFKTAGEHFAAKGFEKANMTRSSTGTSSAYVSLPDQRTEVIKAVSKRDPELAKKFTEQLFADYDKTAADRASGDKDREAGEMLMFAAETAKSNPELARYFFRRVMRYPLLQNWFWALYSTARTDQSFSDPLYLEVLQNYRNELPHRLLYLSAYPFGRERNFGLEGGRNSANLPPVFIANTNLQRAFLDVFFARVASYSANAEEITQPLEKGEVSEAVHMVSALQDLEPVIVERFPDMLQRFGVARSQASSLLTQEMEKDLAGRDQSKTAAELTFDERIKQLEEAEVKGTLTDSMIAMFLFPGRVKKEEHYKAFEQWIAKIRDEKLRADVSSYFWFLRCQLAIKEDRISDAEKMAAKVPELDHRSLLFFDIAKKDLDAGSGNGSAFEALNGVSKLARSAPNSVAKAQVLLSLVQFYEKINHSVALDELGEAIRVVNQLDDPDLFQQWIYRQIAGKDFVFITSISLPGSNFEGLFGEMGKKDFELSLANARSFDDKYFRTIAVLAVAKNCVQVKAATPAKKPK